MSVCWDHLDRNTLGVVHLLGLLGLADYVVDCATRLALVVTVQCAQTVVASIVDAAVVHAAPPQLERQAEALCHTLQASLLYQVARRQCNCHRQK